MSNKGNHKKAETRWPSSNFFLVPRKSMGKLINTGAAQLLHQCAFWQFWHYAVTYYFKFACSWFLECWFDHYFEMIFQVSYRWKLFLKKGLQMRNFFEAIHVFSKLCTFFKLHTNFQSLYITDWFRSGIFSTKFLFNVQRNNVFWLWYPV